MKTPHEIANDIVRYADECSTLGERYNVLNHLYAKWWKENRKDFNSDKSANMEWDLMPEGIEMEEIKLKIKVKDRKISAYKMYLKVLENEAKNIY